MVSDTAVNYLVACKTACLLGHRPLNERIGPGADVTEAAADFVRLNGLEAFGGFLREYQYLVDLWAAHLILGSYTPSDTLREQCMATIQRYATSVLDPVLPEQESRWLARIEPPTHRR